MSQPIKYVIPGSILKKCKSVEIDIECESSKYILVTGEVVNQYCTPLANSAIAVYRIDEACKSRRKSYIGVVFTDTKGRYGISLPRSRRYSYCFIAYCSFQQNLLLT